MTFLRCKRDPRELSPLPPREDTVRGHWPMDQEVGSHQTVERPASRTMTNKRLLCPPRRGCSCCRAGWPGSRVGWCFHARPQPTRTTAGFGVPASSLHCSNSDLPCDGGLLSVPRRSPVLGCLQTAFGWSSVRPGPSSAGASEAFPSSAPEPQGLLGGTHVQTYQPSHQTTDRCPSPPRLGPEGPAEVTDARPGCILGHPACCWPSDLKQGWRLRCALPRALHLLLKGLEWRLKEGRKRPGEVLQEQETGPQAVAALVSFL